MPHADGGPDNPGSITAAWTGGAVDQARGEYLFAGNGGHGDYPGNEAYALALRDEAPAWRRIADPTPNDRLGDVSNEGDGTYTDGRPRAMHSTFECFGDGRIWFPLQNSVTSGGGGTVNGVVSFHRDLLGDAATPLPWTEDDLGAWERWGAPFPDGAYLGSMIFGVCAFDRVDHRVWALGGNSANYTVYWSVDTSEDTLGQIATYQDDQAFGHWGGWVVIAHDLRILVAGDHYRESITVLDLTMAGAPGAWTEITKVEGEGFYESGAGGVYSEASHAIGAGNPVSQGTAIHRLQIPTTDAGDYDASGTWSWTTLQPEGPDIVVSSGNSFTYTKWNVVEDMCNGQAALVVLADIGAPTHVYKIPSEGL